MSSIPKGKNISGELSSAWRDTIGAEGLTGEFAYRLDKLALELDSVADKMFLKTVKAHDILAECAQLTEQFKIELHRPHDMAVRLLTRLEGQMGDLVKTTHEFRIKAG